MRERVKARKQNMKIYSLYRMLSVDHVFFYAIDFIFLTQIKNISAADIVLSQSFFALSTTLFQILAVFIIDKLGNRLSVALANLFLALHVILIINCDTLGMLLLAQFIDAIGFSIKDTADTSLLNASIPENEKKGEIFSKIEGKGTKNFYYFSAISAIIAGWLYNVNVYIPLVFSFVTSILSAIIALGFADLYQNNENVEDKSVSSYFINLKQSFKFIFKSERLKALLLYSGIFNGIFFLMNTYIISLLEEIGAVASIIAGFTFLKSIASGLRFKQTIRFS